MLLLDQREISTRRCILWCTTTGLLAGAAYWQLELVRRGHLFLFALPEERPPTQYEVYDAARTATFFQVLAFAGVVFTGVVIGYVVHRLRTREIRFSCTWWLAAVVFGAAAVADLVTTIRFFNADGIDSELHPAIRLCGYAYGRTAGPLIGKTIQAAGVLGLAIVSPRAGRALLWTVSVVYIVAAAHNTFR